MQTIASFSEPLFNLKVCTCSLFVWNVKTLVETMIDRWFSRLIGTNKTHRKSCTMATNPISKIFSVYLVDQCITSRPLPLLKDEGKYLLQLQKKIENLSSLETYYMPNCLLSVLAKNTHISTLRFAKILLDFLFTNYNALVYFPLCR